MSYHCPACHRVLANRALTHCGFCGAKLPEELRFSAREITALEKLKRDLEQDQLDRQRTAAEQGWRKLSTDHGADMAGLM